ncbi:hypothetical protein SynBMKMC1_00961 [Synechococcus sp. BMK-MC-1]|nr:hypothetical protein SynBMKMC1_00961 [Synechococcus sp. BMK-MC-1]
MSTLHSLLSQATREGQAQGLAGTDRLKAGIPAKGATFALMIGLPGLAFGAAAFPASGRGACRSESISSHQRIG